MTAKEAIAQWVARERGQQIVLRSVFAALAAVFAFLALAATQLIIWTVILAWDFLLPVSMRQAQIGSLLGVGVLLLLYIVSDHSSLEKLEFESAGRLRTARILGRMTGHSMMGLAAGPKTLHSFIKVICSILLIGPMLTVACFRLCSEVWRLVTLQVDEVAKALQQLAKADRRVSISQLIKDLPETSAVRLLSQLSLFDGIIIRGGQGASVQMTETLQRELREVCERRDRAPAAV